MGAAALLSAGSAVLTPWASIAGGLNASSSAKSAAEGYNSQTVNSKSGDFSVTTGGGLTAGGSSWITYAGIAAAVLLGIVWIKNR